jgi:hypothetical protein
MAPRYDVEGEIRESSRGRRVRWVFLAFGAAVLAVAAIIFGAAGPDRSRTTEMKGTSPYVVNPRNETTEKTVPNVDMPTAPRSR